MKQIIIPIVLCILCFCFLSKETKETFAGNEYDYALISGNISNGSVYNSLTGKIPSLGWI